MMMMRVPQSGKSISRRNQCCISRISRVLFCSTGTVASSSSNDTLYRRLTQTPFENPPPGFSIESVLDQWVGEGRTVEREELRIAIKQLKKFKRFKQALQVSEWMSDKTYFDMLPGDVAGRLDLISKVHGLEKAEKYFSQIPVALIGIHVYSALLNCFAHARNEEKTEAVMQKMRELGFAKKTLPYNVMLKLYSDVRNHEKIDSLMQEMEEKGITCDVYTYNIRLNAFANASDLDGMEKLLMRMEADPEVTMDWHAYIVVANGYLRAGALEKVSSMLKKSEQLVKGKVRRFAYGILLSRYASIGKKNEVYRIWGLYKNLGRIYNISYLRMISSLVKLDDLDSAEKIWEEWEAVKEYFDSRIPTLIISAYCKKGLLGNAESIVNRLIESGVDPSAIMWQHLATGYHEYDQREKAVETMRKAILASYPGWKPHLATVAACLDYLNGKGSIEVAVELIELLRVKGCTPTDVCDRFVMDMESAGTVASSSSNDTLYRRLTPFGKPPPGFSIEPVLDQWVGEGKAVDREELRSTIRQLRKFKRFKQALQAQQPFGSAGGSPGLFVRMGLCRWTMCCWFSQLQVACSGPGGREGGGDLRSSSFDRVELRSSSYKPKLNYFSIIEQSPSLASLDLSPGEAAGRLDLISKVHGLEQAEKYFSNVPIGLIGVPVYSALLNCFANARNVEKTEAVMQKMRELGFAKTMLPYNVMLKLYSDVGNHKKIDSLMQEMDEKGITCDVYTYNIRLNAFANASDLDRMEKLLMRMEADPEIRMDWHAYIVVANGYLRAGALEKASSMLKKSEQLARGKVRSFAYDILLTLYASIGKKNEVYRIWGLYKNLGRIYHRSYLRMISSLVKLDDLDGAEKIWEEWEAVKEYFDSRIPSLIISAYCKKGLLGNAESIVNRLIDSGVDPSAIIWQHLATGYHEYDQSKKAVETMRKAVLASYTGWKPNLATVAACLDYLNGKGNIEVAVELIELLKVKGCMPTEVFDRFIKDMESGNLVSESLDHVGGSKNVLEGEESGKS
ncbi:hypothetical protein Vadar_029939 [Vaccinium darrowii]|uniref:Uncharacterized protein n=1 Tax=Vaccinium darrowii TaxID=229202 RepID=A0ACB7XVP6_9ERIC|nr:hypothetical protein Vadar_029939 [Vaccinium darrowii]